MTKTDDNGTDAATKDLENLSSGMTYILQASYDTNSIAGVEEAEFTTHHIPSIGSVTADTITKTTARAVVDIAHHDDPFAAFASTTFKTLRYPSLSGVDVTDITKTTATAGISIADPGGTSQTLHLRYRTTTPLGAWSGTLTTTSTTADASIGLTGLTTDYVRQFVCRSEGGTVILPDGTVKIVVQPLSPPKDVDIVLMKLNLQAHGAPPGDQQRVVVAIESNTYDPGGDTPEDVAYLPYVTLWAMLPAGEETACAEGKVRLYSVQGDWSLVGHCETDESGDVWAVAEVERLGAFALVIDDSPATPAPTPAVAAMATPIDSVIRDATSATVRTSLPAMPPTPVPTAVPTAVPAPVAQAAAAPEHKTMPTPTATAIPQTADSPEPVLQVSAEPDGSGGMSGVILAAIGLPMLLGEMLTGYLIYRERRRRNEAEL